MGKPRMSKKKKDVNAPKAPLSSYIEFCRVERPKVLEEKNDLSMVEVGRELGRRWKEADSETKAVFEKKAEDNRARFEVEMTEYKEKQGVSTANAIIDVSGAISSTNQEDAFDNDIGTQESTGSNSNVQDPYSGITPSDLGFAKQKGYNWHPALKTGENKTGSRVRVTYFGCGQTGTVDKFKWINYSEQVEKRIITPKLLKIFAFSSGLTQLKVLHAKLLNSEEQIRNSGIPFSSQSGDRTLGRLSKDGLQKEEEENTRLMRDKIVERDGSPNKFGCRDCPWKGKFAHKAKGHARTCGLRRRVNVRKPKENSFECSGENCQLSFSLLSQLHDHYRYELGILYFFFIDVPNVLSRGRKRSD